MATLRQIKETLDQATGAQFLYQPVIDRALFEATRRKTATRMLLPRRKWNTPKYIFNKRTNYPQVRGVVEAPPTSGVGASVATSSNYDQIIYPVKHWQTNMDLAKFSIQTARVNGDLMQLELQGASESYVWWEEAVNFYGSAGASLNTWRPTWDGADLLMAAGNKFSANATPTFALMDAMIDACKHSLGSTLGNNYAFVMSFEMLSTFSRLFVRDERWMGKTTVYPRDDRGVLGGSVTDNNNYIDAGLDVVTYRGVPLVESSFLTPLGTMSTVTAASPTGTDGVIPAGTYYYAVEVVTDFGISYAVETSQVTISSTNHVVLSWTAPVILDAQGNTRQNLFYRLYRTGTNGGSGTETLYAVLSASDITYDDLTNHPVQSFTDYGAIIDPVASNTAIAVTVATAGGIAVPDGVTPPHLSSSDQAQDIFLFPRDPDISCVPVVNEMQTVPLALVNARTQQVALIGDQVWAVRGPGFMAKASNVYVS
jgi:hypothetical protein